MASATTHPVKAKAEAVAAAAQVQAGNVAKARKAKATTAKAAKAKPEPATGTVSVKQLAARLAVDGRELRKWLRARGESVGFGARYAFTTAQANKLAAAWAESHKAE
ncbi:MAG TPA: hypothetical protein VGY13_10270 [Solirubrobacteraceae bacterium]|jgi:phage antirepressor YoqD-like protein|nr:hypothetical protein [Solirubrobacteraceae bacterium]